MPAAPGGAGSTASWGWDTRAGLPLADRHFIRFHCILTLALKPDVP